MSLSESTEERRSLSMKWRTAMRSRFPTTREARALLLLQQEGLIKLKDGAGITATVNDIAENPHNLKIVEIEAAQVSKQLPDVAYAVINGNYAMQAGLSVEKDALAVESADGDAIQQYVNIIAVKEGNESLPKIKALTDVLHSDEIRRRAVNHSNHKDKPGSRANGR